jgi:hypothetical protein
MLISVIASVLVSGIAGFIAINIVRGRLGRAKRSVVTVEIKAADEIIKANTATPTDTTMSAARNDKHSRDLSNTWSQL